MTRKKYEAPVLRKAGRLSSITAANGNSVTL
ncbi:MAG: lasso RiPP family leader peptide-containing protein [Mesorhizobium sp.]|nr:lasso RiPP family leader peptide-containing protein [Mesorhizobium sp.]RWC92717.1 MAG: lasso RiPP family leader peptide-containing protein [Mesorhizobium sp.]